MSVYNGAKYLRESVESILSQKGVDFEFIIVNDGSTDDSGNILAEYASQDDRIKIIEQGNTGLTRALIRGCNEARGEFIARQDVGDISLPNRLAKQTSYLKKHKDVSLISCWTRFVGPENEELYTVERHDSPQDATEKIRSNDIKKIGGLTHHGTAMFRRKDYEKVGGYRKQFFCAQDFDLWRRLTEIGNLAFISEILYAARWNDGSISANLSREQTKLKRIIVELTSIRAHGGDESSLLAKAESIIPNMKRNQNGKGYYFIGRVLQKRNDPLAKKYFKLALSVNPLHLKARLALIVQMVRTARW